MLLRIGFWLVEGEEAVAAVDDVGEDDQSTEIHFFAVAVR